jgi:hypothetical protein
MDEPSAPQWLSAVQQGWMVAPNAMTLGHFSASPPVSEELSLPVPAAGCDAPLPAVLLFVAAVADPPALLPVAVVAEPAVPPMLLALAEEGGIAELTGARAPADPPMLLAFAVAGGAPLMPPAAAGASPAPHALGSGGLLSTDRNIGSAIEEQPYPTLVPSPPHIPSAAQHGSMTMVPR